MGLSGQMIEQRGAGAAVSQETRPTNVNERYHRICIAFFYYFGSYKDTH